jgi:hypothetical protein
MNLKTILSAVGVAALLASPAMAKQTRPIDATPSSVPSDARGTVYNEAARAQFRLPRQRTLNQNGHVNKELNLEGYPR